MRTIASLITNIVAIIAFVIACAIDDTNLLLVSIFMVINSIYWKENKL